MDIFRGNNNYILHNLHYSMNAILSGCNKCHKKTVGQEEIRGKMTYNNADIFQNAYPIINKQNLHKNTPWIFNQIYIYIKANSHCSVLPILLNQ